MLSVKPAKFPISQTVSSASTVAFCPSETQQNGWMGRRARPAPEKGIDEKRS